VAVRDETEVGVAGFWASRGTRGARACESKQNSQNSDVATIKKDASMENTTATNNSLLK
jgi:hypothetical protein